MDRNETLSASTFDSDTFAEYFLDLKQVLPGQAVMRDGNSWLLFSSTCRIVEASTFAEVEPALTSADEHTAQGGWIVGFVAYEAGPALNPALPIRSTDIPMAWFAIYDDPPKRYRELCPVYESADVELDPLEWDENEYSRRFEAVKNALLDGITYQVNLTMRQRFQLRGSAADFFTVRCGVNPPPYAAYINGGDWTVASFSPELFFERVGTQISSKPMKGTVVRPKTRELEIAAASALAKDPKSMAENIMIVDMVRNDLGSIADVGSVRAPKLLEVERHRDLLQMTSTVRAESAVSTLDLFRGMFPPASITGAPKVSTCRLIAELEDCARGVYCGAIGFMAPGRQRFNVAIRTAWIDKTGKGEFGIGSGLVWDSQADQEYAECLAKRDFLLNSGTQWALIEAIPGHEIQKESIVDRHLNRMRAVANRLRIQTDWPTLRSCVLSRTPAVKGERIKIRVALRRDGAYCIEDLPSAISGSKLKAALASNPVQSHEPNLRIKTTSRAIYDSHLDAHPDADEVLLYNESGELTEFCRGNVVLQIDGKLLTPYPTSGCLDGVGVARLVETGEAEFKKLVVADALTCEAIYFVNSVVGLVPVEIRT